MSKYFHGKSRTEFYQIIDQHLPKCKYCGQRKYYLCVERPCNDTEFFCRACEPRLVVKRHFTHEVTHIQNLYKDSNRESEMEQKILEHYKKIKSLVCSYKRKLMNQMEDMRKKIIYYQEQVGSLTEVERRVQEQVDQAHVFIKSKKNCYEAISKSLENLVESRQQLNAYSNYIYHLRYIFAQLNKVEFDFECQLEANEQIGVLVDQTQLKQFKQELYDEIWRKIKGYQVWIQDIRNKYNINLKIINKEYEEYKHEKMTVKLTYNTRFESNLRQLDITMEGSLKYDFSHIPTSLVRLDIHTGFIAQSRIKELVNVLGKTQLQSLRIFSVHYVDCRSKMQLYGLAVQRKMRYLKLPNEKAFQELRFLLYSIYKMHKLLICKIPISIRTQLLGLLLKK